MQRKRMLFLLLLVLVPALQARAGIERVDLKVEGMT
jgi:hypothetical protein